MSDKLPSEKISQLTRQLDAALPDAGIGAHMEKYWKARNNGGDPGQASELPEDVIHWAAEALEPQPPIDWIIDGLFFAPSLSILFGEGGSKKTWSMLDAAVCVATGEDWLDFKTQKSNVLIIDEESGLRLLNRRLGAVIRGHFVENQPPNIAYTSLLALDFQKPDSINALHVMIEQTQARLVIIDALTDIMPGADENSVQDVNPVMLSLKRVAAATNTAIVLVHHSNKAGGYRGTTAFKNSVDLMVTIESKQESPNIDFKSEKVREGEPFSFAAYANFAPGQMWLTRTDRQAYKHYAKSHKYVLRYLKDNGPAALPDIMSNADSCSESGARQAVYTLVDRGLARRTNSQETGRGTVAVYELTNEGITESEAL